MAECVRVEAPAKINIHLRVYRRGADGFHGIRSIFQAVSLSDIVAIRSLKEPDVIEIEGDFGCSASQSTVYKAASIYKEMTGARTGVAIAVEKHIPIGAGLGGGSSDAAAVLTGLERLLRGGASKAMLEAAAARIGSDVPFFLEGGAALVSGRGERISPIPARTDYSVVIVFPGFSVGTGDAYRLLDRERPDDSDEPDMSMEELERRYQGPWEDWLFANSFEAVIFAVYPEIGRIKEYMSGLGAAFTAMSGSGSSVFGVFPGREGAERARDAMADRGYSAFLAAPLARFAALV
jgi:4-diphosphocytidyl-2-C-methyl-D-erythritol kinase